MSVCVCLWLNMKEFGNHLHQCIKRYFKNHHQILDCDTISQKGAVSHKWQHDLVQFILFKDEQITYKIGSAVSIICMASMFSLHSYQTQIYKNFIHTCTSKHTKPQKLKLASGSSIVIRTYSLLQSAFSNFTLFSPIIPTIYNAKRHGKANFSVSF